MGEHLARVKESLVELELQRLYDAQDGEGQQQAAVVHMAEWLETQWRDDREFLGENALPALVFYMFDSASSKETGKSEVLARVLTRMVETAATKECRAFFMRCIAKEFRVFAGYLGREDARSEEMRSVVQCFVSVAMWQHESVEMLKEVCGEWITSSDGRKAVVQAAEESECLTPAQKLSVILDICRNDENTSVRELAARKLHGLSSHLSSSCDLVPLLLDASQKVRKIAVNCFFDIGFEAVSDQLESEDLAEILVRVGSNVSGAQQERRYFGFVRGYFSEAQSLDEMCRLSIMIDRAGGREHPVVASASDRAVGDLLRPSFFTNYPPQERT